MEVIEAATLGALFFLALVAPPFVGGWDPAAALGEGEPAAIVAGIIGAAGVGALLQLAGRAMWETITPFGPRSGWRYFGRPRKDDFRKQISESGPFPDPADPPLKGLPARLAGLDYRKDYLPTAETISAGHRLLWFLPVKGHESVLVPEHFFYSDAPDSLVQWCRRRYLRFITARSTAAAIGLGVAINLGWNRAPDLFVQFLIDGGLVVIAFVTVLFALANRVYAQEMETLWFADKAQDIRADKPADPLRVKMVL